MALRHRHFVPGGVGPTTVPYRGGYFHEHAGSAGCHGRKPQVKAASRRGLFRRELLQGGAILGTAAGFSAVSSAWAREDLPMLSFRVLRAADLLNLEARFHNFSKQQNLLKPLGLGQSTVVLHFPPQNIAEAVFDDDEATDPLYDHRLDPTEAKAPVKTFIAGPSWIAFAVPDDAEPFDLKKIDEWWSRLGEMPLRVPPAALPRPAKAPPVYPRMPSETETALELPFRLYISPGPSTRFAASKAPRSTAAGASEQPVELWNAWLASRDPLKPAGLPPGTTNVPAELLPPKRVVLQARAVYSPDYQRHGEPPFSLFFPADRPLSLHALTRHRLVKQMADGDGQIDVEHLVLTALGADAALNYFSQKTVDQIIKEQIADKGDPGTELRIWKHRMVVGRDVFFVEAFFGFLFPFCHPSIYVELTQRKFASTMEKENLSTMSPPGAYLLKQRFILVQDPLKTFASSDSPVGRMMPLKRATVRTMRSPNLAAPDNEDAKGLFFWPRLWATGDKVDWEIELEDESGQRSTTTQANLWFASNIKLGHQRYNDKKKAERTMAVPNVKIAFASEKGPSKAMVQALDVKLSNTDSLPPTLAEAKKKIIEAANQSIRDLDAQTQKIRDLVEDFAGKLERRIRDLASLREVIEATRQYVADLRQVNELGATLETAAITFGSNFLKEELELAAQLESALNDAANDSSITELIKILNDPESAPSRFAKYVATIDRTARKRIANGLASIQETAKLGQQSFATLKTKAAAWLKQYKNSTEQVAALGSGIFHTGMEAASVVLPAVKGLSPEVPIKEIELVGDYVTGGFESAANGVYASLAEPIGKAEDIGGQIRNGLAKPSVIIAGVSRELGAVASDGLDKLKEVARTRLNDLAENAKLKLDDAIPDAKIFGVIPLRKIIGMIGRGEMPDINVLELPDKFERNWSWAAPVQSQNFGILSFEPETKVGLYVKSRATSYLKSSPPYADFEIEAFLGRVSDGKIDRTPGQRKEPMFALILLELVKVNFSEVHVKSAYRSGSTPRTPEVEPKFASKPVEFLGPLAFLSEFQKNLKFGALDFEVDTEFLNVSSNIAIPPLSFGAFSCRNLTLNSALALPYGERALRFKFDFATFKKPFELSVMGFAGRGYFGAAFETSGRRELMGALEFGGALAFDIGVASGGLNVMAGGYLKINNSCTELSGYLRAGGGLDVLGLVHVCVEFFLGLAYRRSGNDGLLYGYCEITVSIDVCFMSYDVNLGMEKTITGSKGEPQTHLTGSAVGLSISERLDRDARAYTAGQTSLERPAYFDHSPPNRGRFKAATWVKNYWAHYDFSGQ